MRLLAELLLVALAGLGVVICLALLPRPRPSQRPPSSPRPSERPDQLVALERVVVSAASNSLHAHASLRPLLSEIASQRLTAHGQRLTSMPALEGRRLLGDQLWELVRPNRPFPEDRHGPGVSAPELAAMLNVLEGL
jgi:hypothetical protein